MTLKQIQGDSHTSNPKSQSRLLLATMITFQLCVQSSRELLMPDGSLQQTYFPSLRLLSYGSCIMSYILQERVLLCKPAELLVHTAWHRKKNKKFRSTQSPS